MSIHDIAAEIEAESATPETPEAKPEAETVEETPEATPEAEEEPAPEPEPEPEQDDDDWVPENAKSAKRWQALLEQRAEAKAKVEMLEAQLAKSAQPAPKPEAPQEELPPWIGNLEEGQQEYTKEVVKWARQGTVTMEQVKELLAPLQQSSVQQQASQMLGSFVAENSVPKAQLPAIGKVISENAMLQTAMDSNDPAQMNGALKLAWTHVRAGMTETERKRKTTKARAASTTPEEEASPSTLEAKHAKTTDISAIAAQVQADIDAGRLK